MTQIGRIVIHKGDNELRVTRNELQSYLDLGYEIGISDKHRLQLSEKHKGKASSKGRAVSSETRNKISESLKGNIPWNKGLKKETDDRVKKYSKPLSEDTKKRMSEQRKGFTFSEASKQKMSDSHKGKNTGTRPPEVGQKISKTKQGHVVSEDTKRKISIAKSGKKMSESVKQAKLAKEYQTKKKNNSFNASDPEKRMLEQLKLENPGKTIYCQYKDKKRYPYYCDFYIVEDDLFIELNAHWTHGGKPYDPNDFWCQQQLRDWQEKAKQSQFYAVAIDTWTKRDVEKLQCAIKNGLNYKTIY